MNEQYVPGRVAKKLLGVHSDTLRRWADTGLIPIIKTPGGDRRYNVTEFLRQNAGRKMSEKENEEESAIEKTKICYCRVSSSGQKDDLQRQIEYMRSQFPDHRIISDIGSGINFRRKGLCTILDLACKGYVSEVVVAYRDRLCRFAFELLQRMLENHSVKLVVLNESMVSTGSNSELAEDLLAIINVYSCRVNGRRKYSKKRKTEEDQPGEKIEQTSGEQSQEDSPVSE